MIYLDNASTTKPSENVKKAVMDALENFGNPSSMHRMGIDAEKIIKNAKMSVAGVLGVRHEDIYFTSGGTESNNLAIYGVANSLKRRGKRVITSTIEHPSVMESFKRLENDGYDVCYLGVDKDGIVNLDDLAGLLTEDTILVSIMHVNNETGVIQPIERISAMVREKSPHCIIHCDCVQSFGKIPVKPDKMGVDMVSISAHKIHGFKGTGALYTNYARITPLIRGGEQQNEVRPGTENVGGILAFSAAA